MTTAAIITTVAAVGGTVGGAAIAAHGQTKAAETQAKAQEGATTAQEQATEKALEFQKQQYANTQKAVAPYQNMGAGALAALGSGLGVTPGNIAPPPISTGSLGIQNPTRNPSGSTSGFIDSADMSAYQGQPQGMPNLTANQQRLDAQNPSSTANLSQSSVRLQSPDGKETQTVPASQAQYYISQGAKVVA
jgi:hypothetical protein